MPDVVCRCGTYVRAYVESGTKINCPQCGVVLTMGPAPDLADLLEDPGNGNSQDRSGARSKLLLPLTVLFLVAAIGVASVFALGPKGLRDWFQRLEASQAQEASVLPSEEDQESLATETKTRQSDSLWTTAGNWQTPFSKIPLGSNIQALSEKISILGAQIEPAKFWEQIEPLKKPGGSNKAVALFEYLKTKPIDSVSSLANTASGDWRILGVHQTDNQIGVLIRYFYEPLSMEPANSGEWVLACRQILSQEEMLSATQDIFRPTSEPSNASLTESPAAELRTTPEYLLLTPRFGYLALIFENQTGQVVCSDLVGIPGEIPLSQTASQNPSVSPGEGQSEVPTAIIDAFGEYRSSADRSLAGSILFRNREDQTYTIAEIRKFIDSISDPRAKRLAEIAEAATVDPSQLGPRMMRFRKEFPNDLGADSLLISIWFTVDKGKRSNVSYDEVGKVYVESAHRLYMKTSDPLMLEIKSRIYRFHGRMNDADKSLSDAEQANHQSVYLLQHRIQEAIEVGNKQDLIDYLARLNKWPLSQSTKTINPALRAKWKQLLGN